jgi:hypothetical protein
LFFNKKERLTDEQYELLQSILMGHFLEFYYLSKEYEIVAQEIEDILPQGEIRQEMGQTMQLIIDLYKIPKEVLIKSGEEYIDMKARE